MLTRQGSVGVGALLANQTRPFLLSVNRMVIHVGALQPHWKRGAPDVGLRSGKRMV